MKKAFSLLEIIVVVLIVGLLGAFAINKFFYSIDKSNNFKIKSDVALINNAINKTYSNQVLLGNSTFTLDRLDDASINIAGESLFVGYNEYILLDVVILSSSEDKKEIGKWIKTSQTTYKAYLSKDKVITFEFDNNKGTFACKKSDEVCKEFML
ncbi:type II secretion system GspH family protein [Arcobacter sp. KX21116]|jgi:general secretion pathway protein G|uniref:type II secretion system protein n=1 Tax=Arcobacter iocasae TaxID=2906515 RepID=UPI0035D43F43|tara:strand:+ start:92937 stop:93398 length:462 start_codon:yes stop_codon:yes gene_type:complete